MKAEFTPHDSIIFSFPTTSSDWSCCYEEAAKAFVDLIETTAKYQHVILLCDEINRVKAYFHEDSDIEFKEIVCDDTWVRDYGVITLNSGKKLDFIFNGWGNKFDATRDNAASKALFEDIKSYDFVLEGGSIESNGEGLIFTTSQCLLEENRNPELSNDQIEKKIKKYLQADTVLWLDHGFLEGDDTDSHIDTLARVVGKESVMYITCDDENDIHYEELKKMEAQLKSFPQIKTLIPLPWVSPKYYDGERLPATYANFLITNTAVIVPTYQDANDEKALKIISDYFHEREVVGVDSSVFIRQHGSIHCLSMQV